MNTKFNGATKISIADPGAAVQYQWQAGLLANGVQTGEIELWLALVFAVCVANGDGQRVNAG